MIEEGNAIATGDTSAGSLAGNGDAQDDAPRTDAWDALTTGGDTQTQPDQAPVATEAATPLTEGAKQDEQAATTEAKPDDDPFAKITDPKQADWQELRGHKDKLAGELTTTQAQLAEYRPVVEKVQAIGGAELIDRIHAVVANPQASAEGVQAAGALLDYIKTLEPLAGSLVAEADYAANAELYFNWALQDRGLDRASFDALVKGGGQPQAQYVPTAYPVPDATGIVRVPSPDGSGELIELDTSEPRDNYTYQLGRREFEREQAAEREKAQTALTQRQTQEQKLKVDEDQREKDFVGGCDKDYEQLFSSLDLKISDTPTKLNLDGSNPLTETQAAAVLTIALSRFLMDSDAKHQTAFREGQEIAKRGGQLAESKRLALKQNSERFLQTVRNYVVKDLFGELHELRRRVASGQTTGAPHMPTDAEVVTKPNGGVAPLHDAPRTNRDPYDDIWA